MPANLKDLRRRIKSIKNTQQITRAMKLVSTAKFGKAQINVVQARPYSRTLKNMAERALSSAVGEEKIPLVSKNESDVVALLVISSDRGLCGSFNSNIAKLAIKTLEDLEASGKKVVVICIGKKACIPIVRLLKEKNDTKYAEITLQNIDESIESLTQGVVKIAAPFDKPTYQQASFLAEKLSQLFEKNQIGNLTAIYSKFNSAMSFSPVAENIIPLVNETSVEEIHDITSFEPTLEAMLKTLIPRAVASRIFQILLESAASEHGARMTAMDSAMRNAKEMLRKLEVSYQRARQAAITNELIEIVSGADAL